jgi:hypothetical protein
MKKLVLTALVAAGLSQAAGCIITSDDTPPGSDPRIIADISLSNAGPNPLLCYDDPQDPRGQDGLRVNARLTGTQSGFSDVYNCTTRALITPPLTTGPGGYDVWVDYINDRGFPNDPTQWVIVDYTDPVTVVVDADTDIHAIVDLAIGNGFLDTSWSFLNGSCPPSGGTVTVDSTRQGPSTLFDDEYACEDGLAPNVVYSEEAMPLGDYVLATQLFSNGNPVGTPGTANLTITDGNEYVPVDIVFDLP